MHAGAEPRIVAQPLPLTAARSDLPQSPLRVSRIENTIQSPRQAKPAGFSPKPSVQISVSARPPPES